MDSRQIKFYRFVLRAPFLDKENDIDASARQLWEDWLALDQDPGTSDEERKVLLASLILAWRATLWIWPHAQKFYRAAQRHRLSKQVELVVRTGY